MRYYKSDKFEEEYLPNPFLSYGFKWKNMTLYGKFIESCKWIWAFIQAFGIIIVILLILGAAMGALGAIFGV